MAQNEDWENDQRLEHDLKLYISQNLKRVEILDYMKVCKTFKRTRHNIYKS